MGTVEVQLQHNLRTDERKVSLVTVGAQLRHNLRTDERKVSLGTVGTQLSHIWGTHFSWGRIKMKASLKVRN